MLQDPGPPSIESSCGTPVDAQGTEDRSSSSRAASRSAVVACAARACISFSGCVAINISPGTQGDAESRRGSRQRPKRQTESKIRRPDRVRVLARHNRKHVNTNDTFLRDCTLTGRLRLSLQSSASSYTQQLWPKWSCVARLGSSWVSQIGYLNLSNEHSRGRRLQCAISSPVLPSHRQTTARV